MMNFSLQIESSHIKCVAHYLCKPKMIAKMCNHDDMEVQWIIFIGLKYQANIEFKLFEFAYEYL